MTKLEFEVPATPIAQPRPRVSMIHGVRRVMSAPADHPVNKFKATAALAARSVYGGPPLTGPLKLRCVFVLPRPKNKNWKRKPMPREWHTHTPDTDNLVKAVKDALNEIVWQDDSQVCVYDIIKWIASGDESPHVEVTIETLTEKE